MSTGSAAHPETRGEAVEVTFPTARGLSVPRETIVALVGSALIWQALSYVLPSYIVPGWEKVLASLVRLSPTDVAITVARVVGALALSFLIGVLLAVAMYRWKRADDFFLPLVRLLMAVPVVCWIMFAVLWFRGGVELRIGFVLVVTCAPIFVVDFLDGMRGVPRDLRDMLWSLRPTHLEMFTKLILPATVPAVLTSWKINLSLAIRVVTMAELVGATSGIGYGLTIAQQLLSVADVLAWTLILVLILYAAQIVVGQIEGRVLRWRE